MAAALAALVESPFCPIPPMRLLIVDDHHEVRRLIRQVAESAASEVRECGDGREAIEMAREFRPHCVTLDVRLPSLSGIDAARGIRQAHPPARIAMVSSFDGPELRQAARLAGARCYVLKDHLVDLGPWLAEQAELRTLRLSCERFRTLLDNSLDLLLETTREGEILFVSPNVREILGHAPDELVGRTIFEHVHPADLEAARAAFRLPHGRAICRYRHRNGAWRWIETTGREFIGPDERPRSVLSVRDISDRKRVEEERRRLENDVRQHDRLCNLGFLTAGIAHDFNNLLAPMGMMIELAQLDNRQPEIASALAQIETAVKRAQNLVQQLLAPGGAPRPEHGPVHLPGVVQEAVQLLRPSLPQGVAIVTHFDPAGSWVRAHSTQMHQVLMNLLGNAVQAVGAGPGQIEIRVAATELPSGRRVRLTVTDTGCGMDAETQRRIFEPFFTTKSSAQGSGLGLASVRRIVTAHGGSIHVASEVGRGSTFQVDLPAQA